MGVGGLEIRPAPGPEHPGGVEIARPARLAPGRPHGEGVAAPGVLADDGPVAGEAQHDVPVRLALHRQPFVDHFHRGPAALVAIGVRMVGGGVVDIQVLLIHVEDGQAPGGGVVVAEADPGQGGLPRPDHVQVRGIHIHHIAQGRHAVGPVRVIGQDRPAGGGVGGIHDPVVGTLPRDLGIVLGQALHVGHLRHHGLAVEADIARGQQVVLQHLRPDGAGIEALGNLHLVGGFQLSAQGLEGQAAQAQGPGADHLGRQIAHQGVAADAHHLVRRPGLGHRAGQGEFRRGGAAACADLGDIGIDPGDEGFGPALRLGGIGGPFGGHVPTIEKQARGPVLLHEGGAEAGGQASQSSLAPQVDLPQPVPGGIVALKEEGVVGIGPIDVGNAPVVHHDLPRRGEAGDLPCLRDRRGRGGLAEGGCRGGQEQGPRNPDV